MMHVKLVFSDQPPDAGRLGPRRMFSNRPILKLIKSKDFFPSLQLVEVGVNVGS